MRGLIFAAACDLKMRGSTVRDLQMRGSEYGHLFMRGSKLREYTHFQMRGSRVCDLQMRGLSTGSFFMRGSRLREYTYLQMRGSRVRWFKMRGLDCVSLNNMRGSSMWFSDERFHFMSICRWEVAVQVIRGPSEGDWRVSDERFQLSQFKMRGLGVH